jgi:predicted alpha/beta hydrolase family esterase
MMKHQIFIVHGGMTFKNRIDYLNYLKKRPISIEDKVYWSNEYLKKSLGKSFQIIKPRMPCADYAIYEDWKIFIERYIPLMKNNIILIGNSLGGIFLARYLSENKFPKKILSTYLICAPFDNTLRAEDLAGGFKLKSDLSLIEKNSKNVYLLFSKDDDVVPVVHGEKYKKKLHKAKLIIYKSKNGHFNISKFPEIVRMIKTDVEKSH